MTRTRVIGALLIFLLLIIIAVMNPQTGIAEWILAPTRAVAPAPSANLAANYTGSDQVASAISFWEWRIKRDPEDYVAYSHLGAAYINQARSTGDIETYNRAAAALREALRLHPNDLAANSYLATVLFTEHDFQNALNAAQQVYAIDNSATQALAVIGDAEIELGQYAEGEQTYTLLRAADDGPAVWSRIAHLDELKGDPEQALELMQRAADESQKRSSTVENAAWYQVQTGDIYFNLGRFDEAATRYTKALGVLNNYYLALAHLGMVRAAQGRESEAISLYQRAIAIIPNPDFLAALGDLLAREGKQAEAQKQYDTVEFIGQLAALNKIVYNRQLLLFYANHDTKTPEAVILAADELAHRKDIYGYDAYAWALYANGRYADAEQPMLKAMSLGTRDAKLYYHAGMIYKALGAPDKAREFLTRALTLNPHFDMLQADRASKTLADLEQ